MITCIRSQNAKSFPVFLKRHRADVHIKDSCKHYLIHGKYGKGIIMPYSNGPAFIRNTKTSRLHQGAEDFLSRWEKMEPLGLEQLERLV